MTTTVVKTIGVGGDYTTLQAWEDACPANLVSVDQVWQGQIKAASDGFLAAANLLTISGTTVDATRYVELTTAAGASFADNANVQTNALKYDTNNGCYINCTAGYANTITVSQEFCRFSKLQIAHTGGLGLGTSCCILNNTGSGTSTIDIDRCIMETSGPAGVVQLFGSANEVRNCLGLQRKSGAAVIATVQNATKIYNSTFAVPTGLTAATNAFDVGNYGGSGGVFENVCAYGASGYKSGSATPTVTTSQSDFTATGWSTKTYANQFQNTADATRDFRLKTGADAIDAGTTNSTKAATSISGTARPSGAAYDVGCWEFVAAATGTLKTILGLATASIKTVLGTAKASIKTVQGLTP